MGTRTTTIMLEMFGGAVRWNQLNYLIHEHPELISAQLLLRLALCWGGQAWGARVYLCQQIIDKGLHFFLPYL